VATNVGLVTTYTDPIARVTTPFFYRVAASNTVGSTVPGFPTISAESAWSNTATVNDVLAPTNLNARLAAVGQVVVTFTDNATNETGFVIERAADGVTFAAVAQLPARNNTGLVSYTDLGGVAGLTYTYRVKAVSGLFVSSAYSNTAEVSLAIPLAPSDLAGTGVVVNTNNANITLNWVDNSNNEAGFIIQRADDINFTTGLAQNTVGANVTTYTATGRTPGQTVYYRVAAVNGYGTSAFTVPVAVTP
jgi:hypothetical protein